MLSLGCELKFNFLVLKFLGIEQYLEFFLQVLSTLFQKSLFINWFIFGHNAFKGLFQI